MDNDLENIFLATFEANKERMFRICRSYATDADDAKDLFQEVLLNLWKSLPSFKHESDINTWVYRVTINVCLRARQFSEKKERHIIRLGSIHFENIADPAVQNDDELLYLKLSACIRKLEGTDQSIILLYLEDLPYKEIAAVFGLSENHVAVKIKRIKSKLFNCLKSYDYDRR